MNTPSIETLLEFAQDAAWQAGRVTLGYFQSGITAERKADNTPVTVADKAAEQKLRELIGRYWPDHNIVGEEFGNTHTGSRYTWIIDPIDGTKSFMSGVPIYSNLLALTDGEKALIGVANFPALNEMVYAVRGRGSWWNGRRAHTTTINNLADARLLTSDLNTFAQYGYSEAWQKLVDATWIQRTWGDSYGYILVATGRAEVMVDPVMALWDTGPLGVILEEAGGTFTNWKGQATIHAGESIATNGVLLDQLLQVIQS